MSRGKSNKKLLLVEYQATNDLFTHFDDFSWQVGSVLIAGQFVFWGIISDKLDLLPFRVFSSFSIMLTLFMTIWYLYSNHNRQIYSFKLDRIHELEILLGFKQNIRFNKNYRKSPSYKPVGLGGHSLDIAIYLLSVSSTPVIEYIANGIFRPILFLVLFLISFGSILLGFHWNKMIKKNLPSLYNHKF